MFPIDSLRLSRPNGITTSGKRNIPLTLSTEGRIDSNIGPLSRQAALPRRTVWMAAATTWLKIIPPNDDVLDEAVIDTSLIGATISPERPYCKKYSEVACDLGAQIEV